MKSWLKRQPKKRMGAGVLLFDEKERLLIVKPNYKTGWTIPGGVVEKNESPRQACVREVREEIGLVLKSMKLVGLDYIFDQKAKGENLQFIFYGGVLLAKKKQAIKLQKKELKDFNFVSLAQALVMLRKRMARRLPYCLNAIRRNTCAYLEDGVPIHTLSP